LAGEEGVEFFGGHGLAFVAEHVAGATMGGAVEIVEKGPEKSAKQRTNDQGGDELRGMGEGRGCDLFLRNPQNNEANGKEKQGEGDAAEDAFAEENNHVPLIVAAVGAGIRGDFDGKPFVQLFLGACCRAFTGGGFVHETQGSRGAFGGESELINIGLVAVFAGNAPHGAAGGRCGIFLVNQTEEVKEKHRAYSSQAHEGIAEGIVTTTIFNGNG
jgi:hypothetical protein